MSWRDWDRRYERDFSYKFREETFKTGELYKALKEKPFGINNKLIFGKHRGEKVGDIIDKNPEYIRWCIENGHLKLNTTAYNMLEERENKS